MSIASCGLGHNGGPLFHDLTPLDDVVSMTISQASKPTGLSRSKIYRLLNEKQLRNYKVGKARLILTQSLRELITELATSGEPPARLPQRGGRFVRRSWPGEVSAEESD